MRYTYHRLIYQAIVYKNKYTHIYKPFWIFYIIAFNRNQLGEKHDDVDGQINLLFPT